MLAMEEQSRNAVTVLDAYPPTLYRINVMLRLDLGGSGTVT